MSPNACEVVSFFTSPYNSTIHPHNTCGILLVSNTFWLQSQLLTEDKQKYI